ncbi:MAG: hypothetical protein AAF614_34585 [Chloroflexota bacterium]
MSDYLDQLRQALSEPLGPHLDDEVLAEMATAEAAGEDIEVLFAQELIHLEQCVQCAEAYAELVELMETAVSAMALPAVVPPEVAQANALWQRAHNVVSEAKTAVEEGLTIFWQSLHISLEPQLVPLQRDTPSAKSQSRSLFAGEVGDLIPLSVQMEARRSDATSCTLHIFVDQLSTTGGAGRRVQITYGDVVKTAVTDSSGVVEFAEVPIAALEDLTVLIEDS